MKEGSTASCCGSNFYDEWVLPMTIAIDTPYRPRTISMGDRLREFLPRLVLAPSFALVLFFVYGFILWTIYLSFTRSRLMPIYEIVGFNSYYRLFAQPNWYVALKNLAIFGSLYIGISIVLGLMLAILLDQRIRGEGVLRPIYLYPMALSFIVTGTAWKWFLNPGLGLDKTMHALGWESFKFDWLINSDMAIYTIVIAAVWQTSGFIMAMFLAGLRGIDWEIMKAAQIDGATTFATYRRIVIPMLRPIFLSAIIVLAASGDQILRPRHRADRRRSGQCHRAALDLHVFLHLHPQPDVRGRRKRRDHADDHRGDHRALSLFGAEGEASWPLSCRRGRARPWSRGW